MSDSLFLRKGDNFKVTYTVNFDIQEAITFKDGEDIANTIRLTAQEAVLRVMNELFYNRRLRAAKVRSVIIEDVEV